MTVDTLAKPDDEAHGSVPILRAGYRVFKRLVPENRSGDRLLAFLNFMLRHKRLPVNRLRFNDVWYKIKSTDEILNPLRVFVSDKEFVKVYVKATVGDQYNVPTIAVLRSSSEVFRYAFPSDCCIKPTHASGQIIVRRDGAPLDRAQINNWFQLNYYRRNREANYKHLVPKVIVEPLIFGESNLADYKFFCFNGAAKLVQVDTDRRINHKRMLFDLQWNPQPYSIAYPRSKSPLPRPSNLDEMLAVAERLAAGFSFVRIDLYSDGTTCYVGEITNCHGGADELFIPAEGEEQASKILFG